MASTDRIVVPVHYDFASSLCFVAHRVLGRMTSFLDGIGMDLAWDPVDLARLTGWRPGARIDPVRVDEIEQIAASLEVPMRVPRRWADSLRVGGVARALLARDAAAGTCREPVFRERIFTAVYEQGRACDEEGLIAQTLDAMEIALLEDEIERGIEALDARTTAAAEAMVTAVPTFMLGPWPFGGIHEEATLRSLLGRYAARRRRGA
jgi:predicted DsbA family dithiol-disulfide isomerase